MKLLAVDPGNIESAFVVMGDDYKPIIHDKVSNEKLLEYIYRYKFVDFSDIAIEMVACYGMPVGREVFETCVWIGRFIQAAEGIANKQYIYRKDEKINLCGTMKAKDGNIRQALIDRFGVVGTKREPGFFYGFSKDQWSAMAVGVTYMDKIKDNGGKKAE